MSGRIAEIVCVLALVALLVVGVIAIRAGVVAREAARDACIASGRAYVVDHYQTVFIPTGKTVIPVNTPVYICVER